MPERFAYCIVKRRYINTLPFLSFPLQGLNQPTNKKEKKLKKMSMCWQQKKDNINDNSPSFVVNIVDITTDKPSTKQQNRNKRILIKDCIITKEILHWSQDSNRDPLAS